MASSLSGLMIAMISFIVLLLLQQGIGVFVVLGEIETHDLVFFADPQAHDPINDFGNNQGCHKAVDDGHCHGRRLYEQLPGVSEEEAVSPVGVDDLRCEEARGEGSPYAAYSVHP